MQNLIYTQKDEQIENYKSWKVKAFESKSGIAEWTTKKTLAKR